jgi:ATP-dependent exoDNAse (exonuclease V) alpha subunit
MPLNRDVNDLNRRILEQQPGASRVYLSADFFPPDAGDEAETYPVEFLNRLELPGMVPHRLELKVRAPVIVVRNLSRKHGVMNGTRGAVRDLLRHSVGVRLLTGPAAWKDVCIPRINVTPPKDANVALTFVRRQLPLKLAYAMTINKAPGQTFTRVGIRFNSGVFSHGQVYVALSRVGAAAALKVSMMPAEDGTTVVPNVVYHEIL